jgi:hypothetical protein
VAAAVQRGLKRVRWSGPAVHHGVKLACGFLLFYS